MMPSLLSMLNMKTRQISYVEAIREALEQVMQQDESVIVIGEGVPDPKAIFNSTLGLQEKFGKDRVFDMPLSENGITGACIGAAISGIRPVMVHQRLDFALLSLDQIINNAAKWHYMFNGKSNVPLVIRMIIGRGWGQGPQHSQSFQALFSLVPGLKVVMPTTPHDAKGMMVAAIRDNNPVIFIEHRWLHPIVDEVPEQIYELPLDKAKILYEGHDLTIAAFSYMTLEAIIAVRALKEIAGISVELIDMRSVRPLDSKTVIHSVNKTGKLIVADTSYKTGSIAAELISEVVEYAFDGLEAAPVRVCSPDFPTPTSSYMTDGYYPTPVTIIKAVIKMLNKELEETIYEELVQSVTYQGFHDTPNREYKGPF